MQEALDSAQTVLDVAKKSGNLKGTMVKLLQRAAGNIILASKELATLSANSEIKALERENRTLKEKLTRMEGEVETLKREMREVRLSSHHPTGVTASTTDLHESRSSAPSAMAESNDRNTALKLLKERREKKGLRKGKTDTTSSETTDTLLPSFFGGTRSSNGDGGSRPSGSIIKYSRRGGDYEDRINDGRNVSGNGDNDRKYNPADWEHDLCKVCSYRGSPIARENPQTASESRQGERKEERSP